MKKLSIFFAALISVFISCSPKADKTEAMAPATTITHEEDSLVNLWNTAWNKNDTAALAVMFNDKSVCIISSESVLTGTDSIMGKWINEQVKQVANLQTQKLMGGTSGNIAYYAGTWKLDVTNEKDSITGNSKGSFTAAWEKQDGGKWIMTSIEMGD